MFFKVLILLLVLLHELYPHQANWARSAQYCRYHGMHLASINSQEEQKQLEQHIQSLGKTEDFFEKIVLKF